MEHTPPFNKLLSQQQQQQHKSIKLLYSRGRKGRARAGEETFGEISAKVTSSITNPSGTWYLRAGSIRVFLSANVNSHTHTHVPICSIGFGKLHDDFPPMDIYLFLLHSFAFHSCAPHTRFAILSFLSLSSFRTLYSHSLARALLCL